MLLISCSTHHPDPVGGNLTIAGEDVRSCDVLIDVGNSRIDSVEFEACDGAYYQRPPRLGISVIARKDEALGSRARIKLASVERVKSLQILSEQCFDRLGRGLQGKRVGLSP